MMKISTSDSNVKSLPMNGSNSGNKEEEAKILKSISDEIEKRTHICLAVEEVKQLLFEIQHEQLKGLVYSAYQSVYQTMLDNTKKDIIEESSNESQTAGSPSES